VGTGDAAVTQGTEEAPGRGQPATGSDSGPRRGAPRPSARAAAPGASVLILVCRSFGIYRSPARSAGARFGHARAARDVSDGRTFTRCLPAIAGRPACHAVPVRGAAVAARPPCACAAAPVSAGACRSEPRRCPGSCAASVTSGQPVTGWHIPTRGQYSDVLTLNRYSDSVAFSPRIQTDQPDPPCLDCRGYRRRPELGPSLGVLLRECRRAGVVSA